MVVLKTTGSTLERVGDKPGFLLGPLFAAEQSQTRQGDVGEHWASLDRACYIPEQFTPDEGAEAQTVRELRSRPAWSSSAGTPHEVTR